MIKDHIASRLCAAGQGLARMAIEIEEQHPWSGQEVFQETAEKNRVQEFTAAAVIMSVACVEGLVNEIFADAEDDLRRAGSLADDTFSPTVLTAWADWWQKNRSNWTISSIDRAQIALKLAGKSELPSGSGSVQELRLLHNLRVALVHSYPEYRPLAGSTPMNELDRLAKSLATRFDHCKIVNPKSPFIWHKCLGAGCARWAVQTRASFENDFYHALGINRTVVPDL